MSRDQVESNFVVSTDDIQVIADSVGTLLFVEQGYRLPKRPLFPQTFDDIFGAAIEAIPDEFEYLFEERDGQ